MNGDILQKFVEKSELSFVKKRLGHLIYSAFSSPGICWNTNCQKILQKRDFAEYLTNLVSIWNIFNWNFFCKINGL